MSTIQTHHGHRSAFVAAAAVVGILGAAAVAGAAWHEHTSGSSAPPATHIVLHHYGSPVHPSMARIHHEQSRLAGTSSWPTQDGRRVQLGR
jgi:hypothetical protein